MIKFGRYKHIGDLFSFYAKRENRKDVLEILSNGINDEVDAEKLCLFAWSVAGFVNEDCDEKRVVLGSADNTDMIPDISHEMTKLMKGTGYYPTWKSVSYKEML